MALRFGRSMFWCWTSDGESRGMVGLSGKDLQHEPGFRDALAARLCAARDMAMRKEQSRYNPVDCVILLYDHGDAEQIEGFHAEKMPGLLDRLFRTDRNAKWGAESSAVRKLIAGEIETNHDFTGVLVYSSGIPAAEVRSAILQAAADLGLDLEENCQLQDVSIYSNRFLG